MLNVPNFPEFVTLIQTFNSELKKIRRVVSGNLAGGRTISFSTLQALPYYALPDAHSQKPARSYLEHHHINTRVQADKVILSEVSQRRNQQLRPVLALMVEGLNNTQIAGRLVVSPSTIKSHVSNILSKLGVAESNRSCDFSLT